MREMQVHAAEIRDRFHIPGGDHDLGGLVAGRRQRGLARLDVEMVSAVAGRRPDIGRVRAQGIERKGGRHLGLGEVGIEGRRLVIRGRGDGRALRRIQVQRNGDLAVVVRPQGRKGGLATGRHGLAEHGPGFDLVRDEMDRIHLLGGSLAGLLFLFRHLAGGNDAQERDDARKECQYSFHLDSKLKDTKIVLVSGVNLVYKETILQFDFQNLRFGRLVQLFFHRDIH